VFNDPKHSVTVTVTVSYCALRGAAIAKVAVIAIVRMALKSMVMDVTVK